MTEAVWNGHTQGMTIRKVIIYFVLQLSSFLGFIFKYIVDYSCILFSHNIDNKIY